MKTKLIICLIVLFLMLSGNLTLLPASDSAISQQEVETHLNKMIFNKEYKYKILKVSENINGLCVVAISPPYREFPNVIIFKYNFFGGWKRVFEGLCIGIQAEKSKILDLHTVKLGADVIYSKDGKPIKFDNEKIKQSTIDDKTKNAIIIQYDDFTHLHVNKGAEESYTIDKSNFRTLAIKLLGDTHYPRSRQECVMFDMPELIDIEFKYKNDRYLITGYTNNNQIWNISFDNVDSENMFIENKEISVTSRLDCK